MTIVTFGLVAGLSALAATLPAFGADAAAGKTLFRQQCSICHTAEPADSGGAQGPSLIGLYGRHAATAAGVSYTAAMRAANLAWGAPTLEQVLAAPPTGGPGRGAPVARRLRYQPPAACRPTGGWTLRGAYIESTPPPCPHPSPLPRL